MRCLQPLRLLVAFVFSAVALVGPAYSQQPGRPQEIKPLVLRPVPASAAASDSGPVEIEHLEDLASRLMHHAVDAGCRPGECKILVTDFVFPDGATFPNGIQWADDLASVFVSQGKKIQVVDRDLFKNLLQKERISSKLQNSEPAARWLGKQFDATVVLVGKARMIGETIVELSARFLNVNDENLIGPSSEVNLQVISPKTDLASLTGLSALPPLPPFPDAVNGEKMYRMGIGGVDAPSCYYMPTPRMTEAAAAADFSGIVLVEAAVGTDGAVRAVRIVKGAPFGLGDEFVKVVQTWKCKPAQLEGKPVAVVTQFEVNFRSSPSH